MLFHSNKSFAQEIERKVTLARRSMAADEAKKAFSKKTAKVEAFRFTKGRNEPRFEFDSKA